MTRNDTLARRFLNGPLPWLVYLPFYFLPWFWQRPTQATVIAAVVALVIFLPLYLSKNRISGWSLLVASGVVMVVAVALSPLGGNWTVFAIYAASMAGALRPVRLAGWTIGAFAAVTVVIGMALAQPLIWWIPGVLLVTTTGLGVISREAMHDRNDALLGAQEEVRRLSEMAERERITRDLHDVVGRTLTLVALKSDIAARMSPTTVRKPPRRCEVWPPRLARDSASCAPPSPALPGAPSPARPRFPEARSRQPGSPRKSTVIRPSCHPTRVPSSR